ncbi:MAG: NADH oxidase [Actinomycetia bacterium]|nr:NADH oxidase [Actinomycetes bacterium]MCP4958850.1 NADH oxidase [Actinomycetes bacterium]
MSAYPESCLELVSTLSEDSTVIIGLRSSDVADPRDNEVVVRIEAAPINPSDMGALFARGDTETAEVVTDADLPTVRLRVPVAAMEAQRSRVGLTIPVGNEGAGTVVSAGSSPEAQALVGRVVGFLSRTAYAEYRTLDVSQCLLMDEGTTAEQAAAPFVNPLTALGMVETMRAEGHTALVHTVGASNLGLMLNRICLDDGVDLVNIVRSQANVDMLKQQGATHVCDSSSPTFRDDLVAALRASGATIAFDAIGGGEMADDLLWSMEQAQVAEGAGFSPYGSDVLKQVYVYGGLDRGETTLKRNYGMRWAVGGWLLTPFLVRIGAEAADRLRARVAREISTTFASSYGMRLSLADVVDPAMVARYGRAATGEKALVTPRG